MVPFCFKHGFGPKVMFVARNTSPFTITNVQMCFGLVVICSCVLWPWCHNSKGGYYVNRELCLNNWSKLTYIRWKQFLNLFFLKQSFNIPFLGKPYSMVFLCWSNYFIILKCFDILFGWHMWSKIWEKFNKK